MKIPNEGGELGKYDDETELMCIKYRANMAVLIMIGGKVGNGFSVSTNDPKLLLAIPAILRDVANNIEKQNLGNET